jgi:hypothetical protein
MGREKWEPWIEFDRAIDVLAIDEPPCRHCREWIPHRKYDRSGNFSGIVCCVSDDMWPDFSCYKPIIFVSE